MQYPPGGRISASQLVRILGDWRQSGSRNGARDLRAAIELQVVDGCLPVGTRLPAERELARALGVSRNLLGTALDTLRERGLVASRQGSGSWIDSAGPSQQRRSERRNTELIDFARASPPAADGVAAAFDAARAKLPDELAEHGYCDTGLPVLRERIAARYTVRGLPTTPSQILVTNGAHHAFVLALRMLAGPGDRVLVEQPTYPNALEAIRSAHAIGVPVPVDATRGWDVTGIDAALRQAGPRLAYLVVDFHNPTGLRMDSSSRERLAGVLTRARTPAVVDETFVDLDLDYPPSEAPPPFAAFARDWTVTIGSAAKAYWGGLRLGWIRAPQAMIGRLLSARYGIDLGSPVFEQLVLAELLDNAESVLARRRADMRARRDTLVDELHQYCPEWTFWIPSGGLSLWCLLPEPMSTRLAVAAGNLGLQLAPGPRFGVHGGLERWIKLPFTLPAQELSEAVGRLRRAADTVREFPGESSAFDVAVS